MKRTILSLLFISISFFTFSQSKPIVKEDIMYLTIENGVGIDVPVRFDLFGKHTLDMIKNLEYYKFWKSKNITSLTMNETNDDDVIIFLSEIIKKSSRETKFQLKNISSYNLIENSKGSILVSGVNSFMISFPFKGENGYGISKTSEVMISVDFSKENVTYKPLIL